MNSDDAKSRSAPELVAPCDATSAFGREVTFVWEPVEAAERYRLQVAPTANFDDPIVDADVGDETAVTVGNQFPTDGSTLFWRVLAGDDEGWDERSSVESFLATTEEESEVEAALVGTEETVTELARSVEREQAVEAFDYEDQFEEEKERGVAYEGVAASQIMGIAVSIIVVILVAVAVLFGWYEQVSQDAQQSAVATQQYEQIRQAEAEAEKHLQEFGVVDRQEGIYHIPIDRAMELVATEQSEQSQ